MDFTGIFNAIISAFGADKTLGKASADAVPDKIEKKVRLDDQEKMTPQATQATQTPQQSKKVKDTAVFKTKTPPLPPTSSPPAPPKTSRTESERRRRSEKEGRGGQGTKVKQKKSIIIGKRLERLRRFFKEQKKRDKKIIKRKIQEYDIVENYAKNNNRDIHILLENLKYHEALLFLKSRQDTGSTSIIMGKYSANQEMFAHNSSHMQELEQFRNEHKDLFNSLANAGLDPLNQGGSSFKDLMPSNSPKPKKTAQTIITSGPPRRVIGG